MTDREMEEGTASGTSRRAFLGGAAAMGAAAATGCQTFHIVPRHVLGGGPRFIPPSEKLNIGVIGCGGQGAGNTDACASENIVALCDVDHGHPSVLGTFGRYPGAKQYQDYRVMLTEMGKDLDAVIVATPDHTHAPAGLMAMEHGLHLYCQKPLTHDIWEAREMGKVAARRKLVTQMGNQGTSEDGLRRAAEIVQSGLIGDVTEVHVWTNRPVWPQGMKEALPAQEIPPTLNWDLWLGTAPERDYNEGYAPFKWRGWWDFGTGALGDMACHTANMPFFALDLGYATSVEAEVDPESKNDQTFPKWSKIHFDFPARKNMPPVAFHWYDGKRKSDERMQPDVHVRPDQEYFERFRGVATDEELDVKSGCMLIGSKGSIFSPNDYGAKFHVIPSADYAGLNTTKPEIYPSSPGHFKEWIDACKGQGKTLSHFGYAAKLTEAILLGNVALRVEGKMKWDGDRMKSPTHSEVAKWVKREYRTGY